MFRFFRKKKPTENKISENKIPPKSTTKKSKRELLIERLNNDGDALSKSRVFDAFNPSKPISDANFLLGRDDELDMCLEKLMSRGNNILLYGNRGVGKSSIGYVIRDTAQSITLFQDYKFYIYRCDSSDTLQSIFSAPLRDLGWDVDVTSIQTSESSAKGHDTSGEIEILGARVGVQSSTDKQSGIIEDRKGSDILANSARWISEKVATEKIFIFIDELDKIANEEVKHGLATIVKHVSDTPNANLKFMLAGIAQNAAELTAGHPSVQRCLAEIEVGRLEDRYLIQILEIGEKIITVPSETGDRPLTFTDEIKKEIARKSFGYPYFTHLIALAASIRAVKVFDPDVDEDFELNYAIDEAVKNAEGSLIKTLEYAIKDDENGNFRRLLIAAAEYHATFLSATEWRTAFQERWENELSQGQLSPYLRRLVAGKDDVKEWKNKNNNIDPIFIRESSGLYRFHDARMPSFIRLALSGAANDLVKV